MKDARRKFWRKEEIEKLVDCYKIGRSLDSHLVLFV
jgi:hypothetical protein